MALNRNIELTTEEQEELAKNLPNMLKAIEEGSPVAPAWIANWRAKRSVAEEAREQAEEIQRQVASAIEAVEPEQGNLGQWCGFPTDMTRCSPFFPMNPNELGDRRYLEDYLITSANWGKIKYTGPQLSTYDEDVLLVILSALDLQSSYKKISFVTEKSITGIVRQNGIEKYETINCIKVHDEEVEGSNKTYTYKGPMLPLLRILGIKKVGKTNYDRFFKSLRRLIGATLELTISTGKTKSGRKRQPKRAQISAMLANVDWDDDKRELSVTVNPFFYETYMAGRVTLMDVAKRMSLKGVISRALYRFVQSQRQNPVFVGHFLTLTDALNMDREQPAKKTRQLLKTAINELIRQGVLMKKSGFVDTDVIRLERAPEALPSREQQKLES